MYGSWKFHCRGPSKPGTSRSGTCAAASNGSGVISFDCAPTSNVVAANEVPTAKQCTAKASEQVTDSKRLVRIIIIIMSPVHQKVGRAERSGGAGANVSASVGT